MSDRFEQLLVEHCSPALAGRKPANLFFFRAENAAELCCKVSFWNKELSKQGIGVRIIKGCRKSGRYLIYLYRRDWMNRILSESEVLEFLSDCGYNTVDGSYEILRQLSGRLCLKSDFPHELGIFLGYPLSDVKGFITNHGQNYTYSGHWKSYGDPNEAKRLFGEYKRCTERYKKLFNSGVSISELVVAA